MDKAGRNDPCPCGSGKKYKRCHGVKGNLLFPDRIGPALGLVAALLAGGVLVKWAVTPDAPPTTGGAGTAPPSGVENPAPWQYDPATNRHYDPNHGHWHEGPPPAGRGDGTSPGLQPSAPQGVPAGVDSASNLPAGPAPWQYDSAANRHYDPNHGHWHDGPPPPENRRNPPALPSNPEPWQYDAGANQHYHPGHGHWHEGPPPPEDQR